VALIDADGNVVAQSYRREVTLKATVADGTYTIRVRRWGGSSTAWFRVRIDQEQPASGSSRWRKRVR